MSELVIRGAQKAYGATLALRRGDLHLRPGEVHVLMGSNGSGKSTLCKIVAGSVKPDAGEVLLNGKPVSVSGPRDARTLGIGIFYQELSLAARRTVAENICLPAMPAKGGLFIDRVVLEETAQRYIALFSDVAGEDFSSDATVDTLRADQRQLVEIMKALATEADIIIFDEPTSALDRAQVDRFFEVLKKLKSQGRAIVFISHRMDEIFAIGDRVTIMRDGETVATSPIAETEPAQVIRQMVGDRDDLAISGEAPTVHASADGRLLSVQGLSGKGFRDVSLHVSKGEIVGLGGLHGQGQSAVLRALFGAERHISGTIELKGERRSMASTREAIRHGCAYVSGDRGRDGALTGRPILENVTPIHFLRNRISLVRPGLLKDKVLKPLSALKSKYQSLDQPINSLSGGNQQKIIIARWLIDRPDILLLDDPTKGIDLAAKTDLFALIRELAEQGMGIVLYSSEDAELLNNSDRILVFNGGSISRELAGADRTRFNLYQAAYEAAQ